MGDPVKLDFSKAQPVEQSATLDFSKAQPLNEAGQQTTARIGAEPSLFSAAGLKSRAYRAADYVTDLLPAGGGILGGTLGAGAGPAGAVGGATLGGAGGEALRQLSRRALGFESPQTSGEAAKGIAIQGGVQGAAEGTGQLFRMAAPGIAESALGIGKAERAYGKTPGMAILKETRGVRPATVERSAKAASDALQNDIEGMAASHQGTVSLQPARDVVENRAARAIAENDSRTYKAMTPVSKQLGEEFSTGATIPQDVPATKALNLKRGVRNQFVKNWNPEMHAELPSIARQSSGAIDTELDRALGLEFASKNQRLSSLIPVAERAESVGRNAGVAQSLLHRVAVPTGALISSVGLGMEGYNRGGAGTGAALGTLGLAIPVLAGSPTGRMMLARMLYSKAPAIALHGATAVPSIVRHLGQEDEVNSGTE